MAGNLTLAAAFSTRGECPDPDHDWFNQRNPAYIGNPPDDDGQRRGVERHSDQHRWYSESGDGERQHGRGDALNLAFGAADAASPVAQTLSVQNGTGTNTAGAASTIHVASLGTGTGVPGRFSIQTGALSPTSGTTAHTAVDRHIFGASKVLANNTTTTVTNVTAASNTVAAGVIDYTVEVWDGTDLQTEVGSISYMVTNKGGVFSGNTTSKFGNQQNMTSGTLAVTWTLTGANPALLQINANSSLSPSSGYPRVTYALRNLGQQAVAIQ
jgi:hypothetical protein